MIIVVLMGDMDKLLTLHYCESVFLTNVRGMYWGLLQSFTSKHRGDEFTKCAVLGHWLLLLYV